MQQNEKCRWRSEHRENPRQINKFFLLSFAYVQKNCSFGYVTERRGRGKEWEERGRGGGVFPVSELSATSLGSL